MNNWCKQLQDQIAEIRAMEQKGVKISDGMVTRLVHNHELCKILEMDTYRKGYKELIADTKEKQAMHNKNNSHNNMYVNAKTHDLTKEQAMHWVANMQNADGTTGGYWTMAETTDVAHQHGIKFDHITECEWYVVMNMMYSDYGVVASEEGTNNAEHYVRMTKAYLFDKDVKNIKQKLAMEYEMFSK